MSMERDSGNPVAVRFISFTIGCESIAGDERYFRSEAGKLADRDSGRAPNRLSIVTPQLFSTSLSGVVIGNIGLPDFERWIAA